MKRWRLIILAILSSLGVILVGWGFSLIPALQNASHQPIDAIFVLGGSIRREMYVSELAHQYPNIPILISNGSKDPCVLLLFQRSNAPLENVWLEKCAQNTFQNFVYSVPILKRWGAKHIKLITSPTHLPRSQWMAQIHFGAHKMWVEMDIVQEIGVPGNREFWVKTLLDIIRSLFWALLSQGFNPLVCNEVVELPEVNLSEWLKSGFECEYQGDLNEWIEQLQNHKIRYFVN
ncbi:YdcF family protein [Spirulina subsalsa FACHB-351]|uniref:YdcF family protein n=1 Tax=Spirulina subsalsa FACHB-351 TaxID=234711 RepID=A0ABT3LCP4_9CYAN|nr:YdcF family protein [Spirulina subsalsa]MCW6038755.1 YdcF family protein [Spirulina subsalsa FACHB-351]